MKQKKIEQELKKYKKMGFDKDQMLQIEFGIEKCLDIKKYADFKFNSRQMFEIRQGLKTDIDVSKYTDPKLNDIQMEHIRKNLEKSKFKDRKKDMPEIEI